MRKTNSIILAVFIIGTLLLSFVPVTAYTIETSDLTISTSYIPDNWFGRIISKIKFNGLFTVYGDELGCDTYPSETIKWKNNVLSGKTVYIFLEPGDAMFVNWFRGSPTDGIYSDHPADSRQFMEEVYLEYGKTTNNKYAITCDAGNYWNNDCYFDIYDCPLPCYLNSDCDTGEYCEKSVLSQKIPNAGVCKVSNPTHTTQVYRCADGTKTPLGGVTYGNVNFCTNPSASKYLIGTTDQCLSSAPTVCSQSIQCSTGQTKCEGTTYYTCSSGSWVSQGLVDGKCGYTSGGNGDSGGNGEINCSSLNKLDCQANLNCEWNSGFLGIGGSCQATTDYIPVPTTIKKVKSAPSSVLKHSVCNSQFSCPSDSECIVISNIISEYGLSESKSEILREDFCSLYGGEGAVTFLAFTDSSYFQSCKALTGKQKYFEESFGFCIEGEIEEKDSLDLKKYFGWAGFIPITGDEGIDGLITIIGLLILLGFIFKK